MSVRALLRASCGLAVACYLLALPVLARAATPVWNIRSIPAPTNFAPGDTAHDYNYEVIVANRGGSVTDGGPITVTDTLPPRLTVRSVELLVRSTGGIRDYGETACGSETSGEVTTVKCTLTSSLPAAYEPTSFYPSEAFRMIVHVDVPAEASGLLQNTAEVAGGTSAAVSVTSQNPATPEPAEPGLEEFRAELTDAEGQPVTQGGGHPLAYTTSFAVNTELPEAGGSLPFVPAGGDVKNIEVRLPPGLVGNPQAAPRCTQQQFGEAFGHVGLSGNNIFSNRCPDSSAVGLVVIDQLEGRSHLDSYPIYNLVPPKGMPAQFGFQVAGAPIYIDTKVRTDSDYGVTAYLPNTTEARPIAAGAVTFWGVPAVSSHDRIRGLCLQDTGFFSLGNCPFEGAGEPSPFLRLPTSCASPLLSTMSIDTWLHPGIFTEAHSSGPVPTACSASPFAPSIEARPTTDNADSPSGLHFDLHNPQPQDAEAAGEADLRDATVTFPPGFVVNPSSADGLDACSEAQIGYQGESEGRPSFSGEPDNCPDASKIGTVTVKTPLVDHPLPGAVYLAKQGENPFGSLLAIYIAVNDPETGVVFKLAGHVEANPQTGQLTTTVTQNPQLPFEDFELDFFEGARAPLRTPPTCGTHTTNATLVPWSAPEGPTAHPASSFQITQGPGGCHASAADLPASPSFFQAGTEAPIAGANSPIITRLGREDGSQEFSKLTLNPPPGLLASLAGIPYCSDSALAAAAAKSGRAEQASPSCPPASQVGTVTVGAGAGPAPYHTSGKAYLSGSYEGAPLSLTVVTPAVAGPFDLGTVVVRAALHLDPVTAQITATTDQIPHILDGIPLDIRSVAVRLDHPGWGLNPTSCEPSSFTGSLQSLLGSTASLSSRFQVGECARLGFKPKLSLSLQGKTRRGGFPALRAVYVARKGDANLASMVLRFPRSEFIEQGHFRTICTRVQWAAGAGNGTACPPGSVYGHVRASTPLLDKPLEGPVYLRSSNHQLPDVVFALRGQVSAEVAVRIDSVNGGLRASIESAPDVPISKVVLTQQGGKKGLFVNSRDICAFTYSADASLEAQNARTAKLRAPLRARCPSAHAKRHSRHHGG